MRSHRFLCLVILLLLVIVSTACGDVKLAGLFSDNMVLQRHKPVPVWGWAAPGEAVSVSLNGQTARAVAGTDGRWTVKLTPMQAGGPFDMTVTGKNTLTVKNVLIGEVWVASGQSNMQFGLGGAKNAAQEIAAAKYPEIRMFTVPDVLAMTPQDNVPGSWAVCTPQTAGGFSAVGYFFARDLWDSLGVPIGIIHTSWGGTPAQSWTDEASLKAYPALKSYVDYKQQHSADGDPAQKNAGMPTVLYNAMIAPLIPYAIQGAIWYQGESNASDAATYRTLFPAMIQGWRRNWGQGDFPFLFVQLANYQSTHEQPTDTAWAQLREAQTMTLRLSQTGMAVITDVGTPNNIHPPDKQDVGQRLALWAEHMAYGKDVVFSGPLYESMDIEGGALRLHFKSVDGGLVARSGAPLKGFAIAGADGKFVWADAVIDGATVVVKSPQVPHPAAVRYAWDDNPVGNLYNWARLPASPFRTDAPAPPVM